MTEKPELMVMTTLRPQAMARLEDHCTLLRWDEAGDREDFLRCHGPGCRAVVTSGHVPLTRGMLDAMPDLRLVSCSSAGYDAFDADALAERGIALTNTSRALHDDVADTAMMLILAARRALVPAEAHVRSGAWARDGAFPLQRKVAGTQLGIVGMGTIGQSIATRAQAFGMQVAYWNRSPRDLPWPQVPDLVQLARDSDHLVAIVAGGEGTRGLISERVLEALGPEGLFVNVARGTVVDEAALIATLTDGRLGAAALDVYENEPAPDTRLTGLPNVLNYPHHASGTVETRDAMAGLAADNVVAFFAGAPLISPVDLGPR
ncbi:2-hydroxyacid dehydrogenase [Paracoccus sp. 1_MG-2023]|uniref:2-hydroxyacid dehydrogenase n=1 Tax=unclassified Paracoccus (in: a-proteobacteria) TaxID=2688777 RepID=UPI001C09832D|nr:MULTISPECIES: 2-hydroxyacid dehydrogenase [unclassified Paracoccus (in: a-proteobacteria)]MBU2958283.1 2-hydroxyacid dehydrogenase [Paracoccus sp. C2R09]MDO6668410.1 2-hydroxyacid dehydrogenase [Paracoccus sp. 1_MG-2023]